MVIAILYYGGQEAKEQIYSFLRYHFDIIWKVCFIRQPRRTFVRYVFIFRNSSSIKYRKKWLVGLSALEVENFNSVKISISGFFLALPQARRFPIFPCHRRRGNTTFLIENVRKLWKRQKHLTSFHKQSRFPINFST